MSEICQWLDTDAKNVGDGNKTVQHDCVRNHGICSSELLFHNHGSRLITS